MIQRTVDKEAPGQTEIIYGNGYLEVKSSLVRKNNLVKLLLSKIASEKNFKIDLLFYLGNDTEDELVFEYLKSKEVNKNIDL